MLVRDIMLGSGNGLDYGGRLNVRTGRCQEVERVNP